ncbi:DUF6894 family protein [Methylobacterium nigriterrae]|uniref:DUF6894 family protein n=1 Tax=Methylobacterium nigriterrae TaxID=3127512 RepID=UPI003D67A74C
MPRYFVDLHCGALAVKGVASFESIDDDAAKAQAIKIFPSIVESCEPVAGQSIYVMSVRDRRGIALFHIELRLDFGVPAEKVVPLPLRCL